MSHHLTDADLVLYRQDEAPDRTAIETHLAQCARCRQELETLSRVLALVEADHAPERPASYGVSVWNAIEPRLEGASSARGFAWPVSWRGWLRWCAPPAALAGAVAALLLAVAPGTTMAPVTKAEPVRDAVLVAAVEDHLERTTLMLTELNNAEDGADVDSVLMWAEDLAAANRLYRQSATLSGEVQMGRLLDELERVLLEVAHAPDGATPGVAAPTMEALETLRGRLDTRGVAFKVRLASAELRARDGVSDEGL